MPRNCWRKSGSGLWSCPRMGSGPRGSGRNAISWQLGRNGIDILKMPIHEVMTKAVQTCAMGEDALNVLERMTAGRFRHMPVVDEDGKMLGVISIGDAVSGRLKELAAEKEALTGMIMGS